MLISNLPKRCAAAQSQYQCYLEKEHSTKPMVIPLRFGEWLRLNDSELSDIVYNENDEIIL